MRANWIVASLLACIVTTCAWSQDNGAPVPVVSVPAEPAAEDTQTAPRPLAGAQTQNSGGAAIRGLLVPVLSLSELVSTNSPSTEYATALSGSLAYSQASAHRSFTLNYNGGGLLEAGVNGQSTSYQNLSATQTLAVRRWTFTLGDTLSYLPESPVGGGTGIAGMGQFTPTLPFSDLNPSYLPNDSILTFQSSRLSNSSFGQAQYHLTRQLSVTGVTSYGLLDYMDNQLLDMHQVVASTGVNYLMPNSQASIQYSYSRFGYSAFSGGTTEAHMVQLMYSRVVMPGLTFAGAIGPEFIRPHGPGAQDQTMGSGSAGVTYARRHNSLRLQFARSYGGGSGLLDGALTNNLAVTGAHQFRFWSVSTTGAYGTNVLGELQEQKAISRSVGGQVSRTINRRMSVYWSYTYVAQSTTSNVCAAGTCAFDGNEQVFGFGFFWQPRPLRIGQ